MRQERGVGHVFLNGFLHSLHYSCWNSVQQNSCLPWDVSFRDLAAQPSLPWLSLSCQCLSWPCLETSHCTLSGSATLSEGVIDVAPKQPTCSCRKQGWATLQQVIKNSPVPQNDTPSSFFPGRYYLGTVGSKFPGGSVCQLALAGTGTLCIWKSLAPLLSSSVELPGLDRRLRGTLKPFQAFRPVVGKSACYNMFSLLPPRNVVYISWLLALF